jgi:succinylarginine dihydrolase
VAIWVNVVQYRPSSINGTKNNAKGLVGPPTHFTTVSLGDGASLLHANNAKNLPQDSLMVLMLSPLYG